jgi:hypothetical protein
MKRLLILAVALLLSGCITTRYQRRGVETPLEERLKLTDLENPTDGMAAQINVEARSIEYFKEPSFNVGIIEFTEEGFVNPAQEKRVMEMVRKTVEGAPHGTIMVVFAHGWHHACRTCDDNLTCFRRVLNALARDEESAHGKQRRVVGVYLGWRGRVFGSDTLDYATIWNRKPVAEHIGRTGAKEVLFELHEVWSKHAGKGDQRPVIMVSVGHSLGGAMLLSAIRGRLTGNIDDIVHPGETGLYRIVRSAGERLPGEPTKAVRARFGDLVVLVNPAVEAARYGDFDNDLADVRTKALKGKELIEHRLPLDKNLPYSSDQLPVMLTISSTDTADWPNGILFPISRVFSVFNVFGVPALPRWSELAALGHYGPSITHTLHFKKEGKAINAQSAPDCGCKGNWDAHIIPEKASDDFTNQPLKAQLEQLGYSFELTRGRACEDPKKNCRGWDPHSPFVVIGTDPSVITGHNDIFNPVFVGFLRMYVKAIEQQQFEGMETRTRAAY